MQQKPSHSIEITCFTDLSGTTAFFAAAGNQAAWNPQQIHLDAAPAILKQTDPEGKYIKNIGDAHFLTLKDPIGALDFATAMQEYHASHPSLSGAKFSLKMGLFLGPIVKWEGDIFGAGANQGARTQMQALPGEILVHAGLRSQFDPILGGDDCKKLFQDAGEVEFKGLSGKQRLFRFNWTLYAKMHPKRTLAGLVCNHLERADVELFGLDQHSIANHGIIIWPVVPRRIVTAIHRGQIEILKMLSLIGWKVRLVLADCDGGGVANPLEVKRFESSLIQHAGIHGLQIAGSPFMSSMYDPKHPDYQTLQDMFRHVLMDWTVDDLLGINQKDYPTAIKDAVRQEATLGFLKPALTVAAVVMMANHQGDPCIVLAGQDERRQWDTTTRLKAMKAKLGCVLNPLLKESSDHQERQRDQYPIWNSKKDLEARMNETNLAWWVFRLHCFLPGFPKDSVSMSGSEFSPESWPDQTTNPEDMVLKDLVEHVWPLLNPN